MNRVSVVSLLVGLLALGCGGSDILPPPDPPDPPDRQPVPTVIGRVTNSVGGDPVPGALVSIGTIFVSTGLDGRFELDHLPTGTATLRCTALGFVPFEATITVTSGRVTRDIALLGPRPDTDKARLRVLHAETAWPVMDVLVDGALALNDLPSLTASDYLDVQAGLQSVTVRFTRLGGDFPVSVQDFAVNLAPGADYTVIGRLGYWVGPFTLADDNSAPSAGNAKLRLIHLVSEADLHVYVTAPGADLAAATPILVTWFSASAYLQLPAGDYQVRATRFDNTVVLLDSTLTLEAGTVRSAVAVDASGGGQPFGLLLLEDWN
jgi:hypothetical protein